MSDMPHCGNCKHWIPDEPKGRSRIPQYGKCDNGYPLKRGLTFTRNGFPMKYCDFKMKYDSCRRGYERKEGQCI